MTVIPGIVSTQSGSLSPARPAHPIWPARRWWLALLAVLLVAGALRFTGYNFSLPYIDHPDEPNWAIAGRMVIDFGSPKPLNMQGYPPGIIGLQYFLLRFFHDPTDPPTTLIGPVRLLSITMNLATLVLIALLAYQLAGSLAGLFGALLWALSPRMIEFSRFATADNYITGFAVLAFWLTLSGVRCQRERWTTAGLLALLLAIIFKYQAVFFLPLILLLPLVSWRQAVSARRRRRISERVVLNGLILAAFLVWLIGFYPTLEVNSVPNFAAPSEDLGLPTVAALLTNLRLSLTAFVPGWLAAGGLLGLGWLAWRPLRQNAWPVGTAALLLAAAGYIFGISFYGPLTDQDFRQLPALVALLAALAGVGLALWQQAISRWAERFAPRFQAAVPVVLTLLVLVALLPALDRALREAHQHTLPDRRNDLADYMDRTLAAGGFITTRDNHKTLNREWGGYAGQTVFNLVAEASLTERTLEDWRARDVLYAIVPYDDYAALRADDPQGYLSGSTLLKAYPPSRAFRGPSMVVLRLYPIQHPAAGQLGSIRLIGYDLEAATVRPGDTLRFHLYWQADAPTAVPYTVFNHLTPLDASAILAQVDGPPLPTARRTTAEWNDPEETLISQRFEMLMPADLPPGDYRLITGFYRPDTFERLRSPDGADTLPITTIRVTTAEERP
jgi:4-amino-4-deoxy-L-arabinose transferase-like glycosyltransferase